MDAVWGKGDHIQIVHPGSACIAGRELVSTAELPACTGIIYMKCIKPDGATACLK
jgi:hypothetical protein